MGTVNAPKLALQGKFFGTPKLAALREKIFAAWIRQSQEIRKPLASSASAVIDATKTATIRNGRLSGRGVTAAERALRKSVKGSFNQIGKQIEKNVNLSIRRSVDMQLQSLRDTGLSVPSNAEIAAVRKRHSTFQNEERYGATFNQRLRRAQTRTQKNIGNQLRRQVSDHDQLAKRIEQSSTFSSTKSNRFNRVRTPQPGGSSRRDLERLNSGETVRKANEAAVDLLQTAGVMFAYWRLNPAHKWEDGKEICEVMASRVDPETVQRLQDLKLDISKLDLDGLYLMERYPDTPHPFCRCQPEPHMPAELLDIDFDKNIKVERALDLPEEQLSCSCGETVLNKSMASVINGFSDELGFGSASGSPVVFGEDVTELMGSDGLAQLLAARVSRDKKKFKQAGQAVNRLLDKRVPKIEERMKALTRQMNSEIGKFERNKILSNTSKLAAIAKQKALIKTEILAAQAELESLLSLQKAFTAKPGIIQGRVASSRKVLIARARRLGLRPSEITIRRAKGTQKFWVELDTKQTRRFEDALLKRVPAQKKKIQNIKSGIGVRKKLRGTKKLLGVDIPGYKREPFELEDVQASAAALIEDQKGVIGHLAPGAGKTPTALASVTDLAAKKKIKNALLSTPASIRDQFTTEMLAFGGDDATVTFVIPSGQSPKSVSKAIQRELADNLASAHPTIKVQKRMDELRDITRKSIPEKKELVRLEKRFARQDTIDQVDAIRGRANEQATAEVEKKLRVIRRPEYESLLKAGNPPDSMITVMGHDDLAALASDIPGNYDYVGIDEIHQMTRQSVNGGAFKANQLQKITGGRIKFKVAFTGTATKNNLGELWDISEWVQPGRLGSREDFEKAFDILTFESPTFNDSVTKTLRRAIDDYTYTAESPIKKKISLNSGFFPEDANLSPAETRRLRRQVKMTDHQKKRVATIEREFEINKGRQLRAKAADPDAFNKTKAELASLEQQWGDIENVPKEIVERVNRLKAQTNPESLRDSKLFSVIHGERGFGEETAKVIEVRKVMRRFKREARKTIIHLERLDSADEIARVLEKDGVSVKVLSGSTSPKARAALRSDFNNGKFDVLVVTRAGSTGLNLQKSSFSTIHFDIPQTFAELEQRDARNFRKGQFRSVDSVALIQSDVPLETRRLRNLEKKKRIFSAVDELSKIESSGSPTVFAEMLETAKKPLGQTTQRLMAERGRDKTRSFIQKLCQQLRKLEDR